MIQVRLKVPIRRIQSDNGTEFVNQTLREYYDSGAALHEMTLITISSGLMPITPTSTMFVPPLRSDMDILFQSLFDELLTPPPSVDHPAPEVIYLIAEVVDSEPAASTDLPYSTTVNQDAPSPSNSQTTPETQSSIIPNDVKEDNHDLDVSHMNNNSFFSILILEVRSDQFSSTDIIQIIVHPDHQISKHNNRWTKDHPLKNIIGELTIPVSTRLQLHEQALFYYYDAFLTSVEPKTYKDILTQSCWIKAMQEELNEFERLEAIRIFLTFAAHMNMVVYQMDVKTAFLNAKKVLCAATSPCHYISQNSITMSSPDYFTSNNEDAFSSNIPDYVLTIPDYSPASSGKTYYNASIGKIPLEFSSFYNMKDIQAFYAKELPIPPPVILPPSLVLSQSPISDS
nr:hypothetical protein [Tanacetum cinerariifolium]